MLDIQQQQTDTFHILHNITAEGQPMDLGASCDHAEHEESVCWDCSDKCLALGRCGEVSCQ